MTTVASFVESQSSRLLDDLKELLRIPSISTLPENAADVRRAAEWLVNHLGTRIGLAHAELIESPVGKHPLVYAEDISVPGKPTVLLYGHYDVQPVDPIDLWTTQPFEPTVQGENLVARGASDDKGPTMAALKALEALRSVHGKLPVNIKVLLEGEEECGGQSIDAYVRAHADRLHADCILVLDTGMAAPGVPTLCYGLRGITYTEIIATGAARDLHSGVYGGIAPNPIHALALILAGLKGADGHIEVPSLYDTMVPLSDTERAILERQSDQRAPELMRAAGLHELPGEAGYSAMERASARPTLEVHGIVGGFVGEGEKTVIPGTAKAKVSLRLVPGQEPGRVLEALRWRVKDLTPAGVTVEVREMHSSPPVLSPLDSPVMRAAAAALEAELDHPTEFVREGGSIPVMALFGDMLHTPAVMMGFGLPTDNVHAPNEQFLIANYFHAIRSVAGFLERLGA